MILKNDLVFEDIGYKHTFTGSCFMLELNTLRIKKGFCWDGVTFATCLKACLYRYYSPLERYKIDALYYREMKKSGCKKAFFRYVSTRLFGWIFYKGYKR